jgi:3-oxosteroid 1-dehydrogenase
MSDGSSSFKIAVNSVDDIAWTHAADVVSVGSGGGALCAAAATRVMGGTSVVLEKQPILGGSTGMSGGILWIPNSPTMRRAGETDSIGDALLYMNTLIGDLPPASTDERKKRYLNEGPRMIDFIESRGVRLAFALGYSDYHDELPGGRPRGRGVTSALFNLRKLGEYAKYIPNPPRPVIMLTREISGITAGGYSWYSFKICARVLTRTYFNKLLRRPLVGNGPALQAQMIKVCVDAGVELWPQTPVTGFVTAGGRVVGVRATRDGKEIFVRANKGVLIGSGGFARSAELREQYGPKPASTDWTLANAGDTGEIIQGAQALGAAIDQMDNAWWIPTMTQPGNRKLTANAERAKPHSIVVDSAGHRFFDESEDYMATGQHIYEHHNKVAPAIPSWLIIDSRHRHRYPWGLHIPWHTPKEWITSGYMKRADTIEDLARQCDIDPAVLRATADRFNGFAKRGVDEDFHRGDRAYDRFLGDLAYRKNPCLGTVARAPFYAVAIYPGDVGTSGGIVTDVEGRVVDADGKPTEGLYATGNATASVMGYAYPGPGASIGASFVWGLLSAEHALGKKVTIPVGRKG